jgi:hypothetical protein
MNPASYQAARPGDVEHRSQAFLTGSQPLFAGTFFLFSPALFSINDHF